MAVMTLSNHVLTVTAQGDTYPDWVCIDQIIWTNIWWAGDALEIKDSNGKSVLERTIAPGVGAVMEDKEIEMNEKWARGLDVTVLSKFGVVNIYLKQEPRNGRNDVI